MSFYIIPFLLLGAGLALALVGQTYYRYLIRGIWWSRTAIGTSLVSQEDTVRFHEKRRNLANRRLWPFGFVMWVCFFAGAALLLHDINANAGGWFIGGISGVVTFAILTPLFIHFMVDDPSRPRKPYLFTFLNPGEIKIVMRGGRIIRYMMNWASYRFARELSGVSREDDGFWNILPGHDYVPLLGIRWWNPLSYWIVYVYATTGAIFTGFYPWQGLRISLLQRLAPASEKYKSEMPEPGELIKLVPVEDRTDHLRAQEFLWYLDIPAAEVRDLVTVRIQVVLRIQIVNPQIAAFRVERWDQVVSSTFQQRTTVVLRSLPLSVILSTRDNERARRRVADAIGQAAIEPTGIGDDTRDFMARTGVQVNEVLVLDYTVNPETNTEETMAALTAPWRGKQQGAEIEERGHGEAARAAAIVMETAAAAKKMGADGRAAMDARARVDVADKSETTFMDFGQGSVTDSALLAELRKQRPQRKHSDGKSRRRDEGRS